MPVAYQISLKEDMNEISGLTALNGCMADIDQENVDGRLGCSDHVLCRSDILYNGIIELMSRPSIAGAVVDLEGGLKTN